MICMGTGKAEHGLRITVVMDEDSRYILGYACGTYHNEKVKKGERFNKLETEAMKMANANLEACGLPLITETQKSRLISSFFSSMYNECLYRYEYNNLDDLKLYVDDYIVYYNNDRFHSGVGYVTPCEKWIKIEKSHKE